MEYVKNVEIRWSDLDPNFHLRHSAYYDFGAYCRICFLFDNGVTDVVMKTHSIGPVLFREECFFKREIKFSDRVSVSLKLKSVSSDFRKFSMQHEIYKNDNELAALLIIDGAWMNTELRKIVTPPAIVINSLNTLYKTDDFIQS
jgi:acyl-CoA thioester hydrolase